MMHIFDDLYEKERLLKEKRLKEYRKRHEEELQSLGISEEEWQAREILRKQKQEAELKKNARKNIIIAALIIVAIFVFLIWIAVLTHNSILSGILGFLVGFLILVYLPFFLGFLAEFIMRKKIEFSNWAFWGSIILSGFLGFVIGTSLYNACIYEDGDDRIVYITNYGYCYHESSGCFELSGHKIRSVRYGNIKNSKRACEMCSK